MSKGATLNSRLFRNGTVAVDGSVLHYDGARFCVGPESSSANPGPKCYRDGRQLAVTDANVMTGKLTPQIYRILRRQAKPRRNNS